jgi:hypothetical protein
MILAANGYVAVLTIQYVLDPEIDRVGLNNRSEFNSGRLDRSTRLLTGLTIGSTSLNFDRLNRLTRLQL